MSDSDLSIDRSFRPFGYPFEVQSALSPDDAKAALRKQKRGWLDPKTGPRGWILGSLLCLQLSAIGQDGPVVLARITDDGFGSRVHGRVGLDLALPGFIGAGLVFLIFTFTFPSEDRFPLWLSMAGFLPFGVGILWLRSRFRGDAEPLVRFIRRVLETPTARITQVLPSHFDTTPVQTAKLTVDGQDMGGPPSEHDVAQAILATEADGFLIIDFGASNFMQTAREYDRFILEKSEGSDREFYRAKGDLETNDVIAAMTAYLRGAQPSGQIVWEKARG